MNGTIHFNDTKDLADFLIRFAGGTATFEVHKDGEDGWTLRFLGGF
jgi:hypothetical protein